MIESVNIRKIAELAECSPSTVSRVLSAKTTGIRISDETRARIWAVCRELDYQPSVHAIRLFSKRARCIGFLPSRECFILDDNLARSINTVFFELNRAGYRCLPLIHDDRFVRESEYLNLFKRREIDALIVWGADDDDHDWLHELDRQNLPFLLLTNRFENYPAVVCDNRSGLRQLVELCRQRDARRLLYLNIPHGDCCRQRLQGFLDAAADLEHRVIDVGMTIEDGAACAPAVLDFRPDAVICGNDRLAFGLERALAAAGIRPPETMLITGADNIEMAQYAPVPLTTFDQMAEACAARCVEVLLQHLDRGQPLQSETIAPRLVRRNSA